MRRRRHMWALALALLLLVVPGSDGPTYAQDASTRRRPVVVSSAGGAGRVATQALDATPGRRGGTEWARLAYEALRGEGWLWARVRLSAAQDSLYLDPGRRAIIGEVEYRGADSLVVATFTRASEIESGRPYRPGYWKRQCARGLRRLGDEGYPFPSLSVLAIDGREGDGEVDLTLLLNAGKTARVGQVRVEGATHTRPEVLAKMAGIPVGEEYREEMLERARQRLLSRELVDSVEELTPTVASADGSEVDIDIKLVQPRSTGNVSAALGFFQDPATQETRIYGSVDLDLLDLFGTARQLHGRFRDDGVSRRLLDLSYLEPLVLGSAFDLRLSLGQRHQDASFDTILGDAALRVPWQGDQSIELGVGVDRTSFIGELGRVRSRRRINATLRLVRRRPEAEGLYGRIDTRAEQASVSDRFGTGAGEDVTRQTQNQTIVDATARFGLAVGSRLAVETRAAWKQVVTDVLPIPLSEQFWIGGSNSVRGHREDESHGELISYAGAELVIGRHQAGQAYVFYDVGFSRETLRVTAESAQVERWLRGFGLGLRTPAPFGRLDLSLGFAGRPSYQDGLLHLSLIQEF